LFTPLSRTEGDSLLERILEALAMGTSSRSKRTV
jgi:hypothetical protein